MQQQYKFTTDGLTKELAKASTATITVAVLILATVSLVLAGMASKNPRIMTVCFFLAVSAGGYAIRLGTWLAETSKAIAWMRAHVLTVNDKGVAVNGQVHPWDKLRVEADGGPDLLVFEEANVKVPVDALDLPESFREEAKTASKHTLLL